MRLQIVLMTQIRTGVFTPSVPLAAVEKDDGSSIQFGPVMSARQLKRMKRMKRVFELIILLIFAIPAFAVSAGTDVKTSLTGKVTDKASRG